MERNKDFGGVDICERISGESATLVPSALIVAG
jgi:hypothetical protein